MDLFWKCLTLVVPAFLVLFAAGETYAGVTGKKYYTTWIRQQLGIEPAEPRRAWMAPLFAFVIGGFALWFIPHITKWINW